MDTSFISGFVQGSVARFGYASKRNHIPLRHYGDKVKVMDPCCINSVNSLFDSLGSIVQFL